MQNRALYGIGLFASLATVAFGCSAESADPAGGTGGTVTTGTGGTTSSTGGITSSTGGITSSTGGITSSTGGITSSTGGTTSSTGGTSTGTTGGTTSSTGGTSTGTTGGTTTTGTGGTTTTGTGGTTTSTGGTTTATGGSTTTGGSSTAGATGTGGAATAGCSDGCAELKVPFTAFKSAQAFEIYLAAPADLSAGVLTVKLRTTAGKAGGIQVVLKNGAPDYAWGQTKWLGITETVKADWTTITLDASAPGEMGTTAFDKTKVTIIAIQIAAGDPWYSDPPTNMTVDQTALVNPTIVQVDEITVAGATGVGPYSFTANAMDLKVGTYMPITGAVVTWLPPG